MSDPQIVIPQGWSFSSDTIHHLKTIGTQIASVVPNTTLREAYQEYLLYKNNFNEVCKEAIEVAVKAKEQKEVKLKTPVELKTSALSMSSSALPKERKALQEVSQIEPSGRVEVLDLLHKATHSTFTHSESEVDLLMMLAVRSYVLQN